MASQATTQPRPLQEQTRRATAPHPTLLKKVDHATLKPFPTAPKSLQVSSVGEPKRTIDAESVDPQTECLSTELFRELCEVKRSVYDIKGEMEADLHEYVWWPACYCCTDSRR